MYRHCSKWVRILVAADHAPVAAKINRMLAPELEVVGIVHDNQALIKAALDLKPDVVLIDIAISIRDGLQAVEAIIQRLPQTKIILHTATAKDEGRSCAEKAWAGEAAAAREFSDAIRLALKGDAYLAPSIVEKVSQTSDTSSSRQLTDREYEVLALLAAGYPMKNIAYRLGITYRTVTFHKYRMMERLGIETNAGLMNYAL